MYVDGKAPSMNSDMIITTAVATTISMTYSKLASIQPISTNKYFGI